MTQSLGVSQQEAIELTKKGYAAFQSGDMDTLRGLFTEDTLWHFGGHNPLSGDKRGIDAVLENFMKTFERTGGTFKIDIHDILASDNHVVVLGTQSGTRSGKTLQSNYVQVTHLRDGKVAESWLIAEDPDAGDELLADA
jgi:ketosteroid isomerase-like protein